MERAQEEHGGKGGHVMGYNAPRHASARANNSRADQRGNHGGGQAECSRWRACEALFGVL